MVGNFLKKIIAYAVAPKTVHTVFLPSGLLFPSQILEDLVSKRDQHLIKHLSIPTARISRQCLVELATSSFFQLLSHLYSLETSKMTSSVSEWVHNCTSTIGHAPCICYVYVSVSRLRPQLVPSVYSRPGIYLLLSLVYPWHVNEAGIHSKEVFIRGNMVATFIFTPLLHVLL